MSKAEAADVDIADNAARTVGKLGALPEVVGPDGETALQVEPGNSEALARRIADALDDDDLRTRVGAAGRQRVLDRWTWRHSALGTVEQYRALLEESAWIEARRPGGREQAPRFRQSARAVGRAASSSSSR